MACDKSNIDEPQTGLTAVKFSLNLISVPHQDLKSTFGGMEIKVSPIEVTHVRIGIDGTHESPLISEIMEYDVAIGVTGAIQLPTGNHSLVAIELLKETSPDVYEVLYSGVAAGAPLAIFVNITIPVAFEIPLLAGQTVDVDVVAIDDWLPEAFGWGLFSITEITTVNALYFYGAKDDNTQSVMTMQVLSKGEVVNNSELKTEGWIKVLFPDYYSENNATEMITFNLTKDGLNYVKTMSVAELLALPREVILLNVYGSGMWGFNEVQTLESREYRFINSPGTYDLFSFEVKNAAGEIFSTTTHDDTPKKFTYPDYSGSGNDATEFVDVKLSYQLWNESWGAMQTKTAHVSVATLKSSGGAQEILGIWASPAGWGLWE